jgi:predicted outer membrane repeat protein
MLLPQLFRTSLRLLAPFVLSALIGSVWLTVLFAAPLPQESHTAVSALPLPDCHATHDDGSTVFTSADGQALRQAITAAAPGATVKVAGTCAGTVLEMGSNQVAFIDKLLTIAGGYTPTNWLAYDPVGNSTVVDAEGNGRVLRLTAAATLQGFTLTNGFIGSGDGGGLETTSALTLTDMVLFNNVNNTRGGGAYIGGTAVVHNSRILNNGTRNAGAGLYVVGHATVTDSLFQSNSGQNVDGGGRQGGGLNVQGFATIAHTDFYSNSIKNEGGGAYAAGGMSLLGGTFDNNECMASCSGGAVSTLASDVTISGTQFIGNQAASNGGAVHSNGNITITNTHFANNRAVTSLGGAMAGFGSGLTVTVIDSHFEGNTAGGDGGAIGLFQVAHITNSRFVGNSGTNGGGLYLQNGGQVVNGLFVGNSASNSGTGIRSSGSLNVYHTTLANPSLASGRAIHISSGTSNLINNIITNHDTGIRHSGGTVTQDYNLFFGNTTNTSGTIGGGANSLVGDPAFVDPAVGDYRLTHLSAALNRGTDVGITTDFEGDARPAGGGFDLGFDEAPFATACAVTTGYDYVLGHATPVTITITSVGTLHCLNVTDVAGDHPHATPGIQTGQYWQILGTDSMGDPATGFTVTLTLPTSFVPTANDKVCRYTGVDEVWDCAMSSLGVNRISRTGITQFSDWAVGDEVGPTAVSLSTLSITSTPTLPLAVFALLLLLTSTVGWLVVQRR